jgi:23S rRNA pseudoU1915 N3-methylase RlmH
MEIRLIAVGRLRTPGTAELYAEYAGRIGRCCRFSVSSFPKRPVPSKTRASSSSGNPA